MTNGRPKYFVVEKLHRRKSNAEKFRPRLSLAEIFRRYGKL